MDLPFTSEQFFAVFQRYNEAIEPVQGVLILVAIAAVALIVRGGNAAARSRAVAGILALLWLWMGTVYHFVFFRPINPAATLFAVAFTVQAGLFLWYGVYRRQLQFEFRRDLRGGIGALLIVYALAVYPVLGAALGHVYPASPTFGLPCPTTIFTLGVLLWTARLPWTLLVIPFGWAFVGTAAAMQLGVREDFGLPIAALLVAALVIPRRRLAHA